jgi:molybdate transport system ATP-binding protein
MTPPPLVGFDHVDVDVAGVTVLQGIDWQLERGEHWGVVGGNGAGKTTFLSLIAGALWPAAQRGRRRYDFGSGEQHDAVEARRRIVVVGHELQDRYARWNWNFTALDVALSGVYRTDVPRRRPAAAERSRALAVLRALGIAHLAARPFLELSRGEQRRVLIARGVAFEPTVLLLDEPASGLDAAARAQLTRMIERIGTQLTIVCTAHSVADLPRNTKRVLRLAAGKIAGVDAYVADTHDGAGTAEPATARLPPRTRGSTIAVIDNADVWIGSRQVLHAIDWQLNEHEHWLCTGANGAGKSSFLRLLHGQLRPAIGGSVRWPAFDDPRNVWTLRRRVAWFAPELQAGYRYPSTVRACVASGFHSSIGLAHALSAEQAARVEELLAQFGLPDLAQRMLDTLSYGQARRALIARTLANRPRVLLLDEPWEGLDRPNALGLNAQLGAAIADGTQLVCASHLNAYRDRFTHELVLDRGHIAATHALRLADQ